jgi:hypothetical protein
LKLYPGEFYGMVVYLEQRVALAAALPALDRSIYDQVLLEYHQKNKLRERFATWKVRNGRKAYPFQLPLSVLRILHQEMQYVELPPFSQAFLARLDQELINWQ